MRWYVIREGDDPACKHDVRFRYLPLPSMPNAVRCYCETCGRLIVIAYPTNKWPE